MKFLEELAARRRFGMKPGLETIRAVCAELGDPQKKLRGVVHVAGTNGKGAVCAILDAALGPSVGRYTSPHLVKLNERFFLNGAPVADAVLEQASEAVSRAVRESTNRRIDESSLTFFEALTAVAFKLYAEADPDHVVLETGLGGRLDATNVCEPELTVITKIGLDHCDWLGDTVEQIAAEKAGIVKPGVPVVLARNEPSVRAVVENRAREVGAPFHYAPELADESEISADFPLRGSFNRENAVTALAALKVLGEIERRHSSFFTLHSSFSRVVWPGRFQQIGGFLIDGAHNPPAARALAAALASGFSPPVSDLDLVAGFCGDKDVAETLALLAPFVKRGFAVRTVNPRSLSAEATAAKMREAGIDAVACPSLRAALESSAGSSGAGPRPSTLVCGSLFLAGEALVELGAYPWDASRFDPSEALKPAQ